MFYRQYSTPAAIKNQSARGSFRGPGKVIGLQSKNVRVSYDGRCYLVSLVHIRALSPDDHASLRPAAAANLEIRRASVAKDNVDLSGQLAEPADIIDAEQQPPHGDGEVAGPEIAVMEKYIPEDEVDMAPPAPPVEGLPTGG